MNHHPTVKIYESELEFISDCVIYFPTVETGGDLFGFWSKEGNPVVQYVIGPGDKTSRTGTSFFQDIDYLRKCGNALHDMFGLEHIGAWHSHHQLGLFSPSSGDVNTMRNTFRVNGPAQFLISICNIQNSNVSVGCFLFGRDNPQDYTACNISTMPGPSPIRERLRNQSSKPALKETLQKLYSEHSYKDKRHPSFSLRATDAQEPTPTQSNKAQFSENSFWSTRDGQAYLKSVYDKLQHFNDIESIEISQLADQRPAISFRHLDVLCEIRFPDDFPESAPEILLSDVSTPGDPGEVKPPQMRAIERVLGRLNLFDKRRKKWGF